MRLKDIAELIRCDLLDLTEGAFDVAIKSDDAGYHIVVSIETHEDSQKIREELDLSYRDTRIVIMLVPKGTLDFVRIEFRRRS